MRKFNTLAVFLLAACTVVRAQDNCSRITVPVTALEKKGGGRADLSGRKIQAELRGTAARILDVNRVSNPRIIIMLDGSGSMTLDRMGVRWQLGRDVAAALVARMPETYPVALVIFASDVVRVTQQRDRVAQALMTLKEPIGLKSGQQRTALTKSLLEVLKSIHPPRTGDAVVVITDGGDNIHEQTARTVREQFVTAGVRLLGVLLIGNAVTPEELSGPEQFDDLVRSTGGKTVRLDLKNGVDVKVRRAAEDAIWEQINSAYAIGIEMPEGRKTGGRLKLELLDANGTRDREVIALYPSELPGCNR